MSNHPERTADPRIVTSHRKDVVSKEQRDNPITDHTDSLSLLNPSIDSQDAEMERGLRLLDMVYRKHVRCRIVSSL